MEVEILTDTSVRVSWERILNIPEITHYTVFYSRAGRQDDPEQYMNITKTEDSVVIENLSDCARSYQFVVIAVATVDNVEIPGERPSDLPSSDEGIEVLYHRISVFISYAFLRKFLCRTNNWWFGVSYCCCCRCCSSDLEFPVAEEVKCMDSQ